MAYNEKFNSIEDLYKRALPALKTKAEEYKKEKIAIKEIDIWNYCVNILWQEKTDLRLYEIIDDILNIEFNDIKDYISNREINGDNNER